MPRHPPNALTSRLRVHTTNDNAERTAANGRGYNLSLVTTNAGLPEPIARTRRRRRGIDQKTHSQCQRETTPKGRPRYQQDAELMSSSDETWERADSGGSHPFQALKCEKLVEPIGIEPMT